MSGGLQDLLSLPEAKRTLATEQAEEFGRVFRTSMAGLNRELQVVAAQASQAEHQPFEAQRMRLYEAFQKASAQIDPADPSKADQAIERVVAAVTAVTKKASAVATSAVASRDEWLKREADWNDAILQIGELEEAAHPKAAALGQLGEVIRRRSNDREYQQAVTALEQMRPKLDQIYAQHQRQTDGDATAADFQGEAGDDAPQEGLTILVKDQETGDAIEGVAVTVGRQSDTTSSNGLATVELPIGTHDYEASAEGFQSVSDTVEIVAGDNPELVIEMPVLAGPREGLTIFVRDQETGDAIEGVRVTVGDQSDVTSSNGLATVELPVGTHTFEASSDTYEQQSGDIGIIEGDNPELVIELWPYEAAVAGGGAISTDPKLGDRDLGEAAAPLEELSGKRQTCDAGVDRIIEEHSAEEAGESTGGLLDGDWNVMDGLQQALDVVGQGIEDVAKLPDELEAAAKDVGVDLLMFGAEQVVEQRGLIEQAMQGVQGVLDSDGVKMLGIANPAFEISRTIGLNLARAGEATPEIAQQLVDNEQGIRALTEMNQRETTELALQQIDVGETYETEFHGGAEIHAELGVKAGAKAESKMTKVTENEFQLELTVGGKLQVGVGASAQGEGAAADVGGGIGGKVVVDVKGKTPEEARAQVATLIQLANGDPADLEQIAQLKGVTVSEAEGKIAAILSGDLTPLSVELRGDVVPEYRVIGDESHVGMGAAITIKAEAGGPVNIAVPDNVASLAESPDAQSLDPRARALLGDLPMDVVEEIEDLYGLGGGLKLGAEVQVEANLYAPIDAGVELATSGGLAKHANRLEITLKGKIEAGNSNVEITHQVVVKDLQGLSEAAGMGAEQLAVAMQDGAVTPEELSKLIPNQQDLDQYVDFNSKAEIGHFDGIKIDVLGFGGRMGESNKLTLYEVQDGKMVRKVDDLKSALDQMEANTQFGLFPES